jgi:glycosidase
MKKFSIFILFIVLLSCNKSDPSVSTALSTDPPQYGTPYNNVPDARDAIIYQVNTRAFSAQGDLRGVMQRLDSIKDLGANVLYLMPVYPVGLIKSVNSPYSIKDHKAIGSEFGDLEDLRLLVTEAHKKDMAVILDFVANHTSWDNAWINNKSWYQQDQAGNIIAPPGTNFTDVAQLNLSNEAVRTSLLEIMRYWIFNANVDGYRFDYADNVPFSFWKHAIASLKSIQGRKLILFAEGTRPDHFRAGFDLVFGMEYFSKMKSVFAESKSATTITAVNEKEYANAYKESQVVRYVSNHDVNLSDGTASELFNGQKGAIAAFVVAAYMKGIPMIYNGQEVGYQERITYFDKIPINWIVNSEITSQYKKILGFRNSNAAIKEGQLFTYSSDDVVAFSKELQSEKVFVIVNIRNDVIDYTLPAWARDTVMIDALNGGEVNLTQKLTLQPYSYVVLKTK